MYEIINKELRLIIFQEPLLEFLLLFCYLMQTTRASGHV